MWEYDAANFADQLFDGIDPEYLMCAEDFNKLSIEEILRLKFLLSNTAAKDALILKLKADAAADRRYKDDARIADVMMHEIISGESRITKSVLEIYPEYGRYADDGKTLLSYAAATGNPDALCCLMRYADFDAVNTNNALICAAHNGMAGAALLLLQQERYNRIDIVCRAIHEAIDRRNDYRSLSEDGVYDVNSEVMITVLLSVLCADHREELSCSASSAYADLSNAYIRLKSCGRDFPESVHYLFEFILRHPELPFNSLIETVIKHATNDTADVAACLIDQIWSEDCKSMCTITGKPFDLNTLLKCQESYFSKNGIVVSKEKQYELAKAHSSDIRFSDLCSEKDLHTHIFLSTQLSSAEEHSDIVDLTARLSVLHGNTIPFFFDTYMQIVNE